MLIVINLLFREYGMIIHNNIICIIVCIFTVSYFLKYNIVTKTNLNSIFMYIGYSAHLVKTNYDENIMYNCR